MESSTGAGDSLTGNLVTYVIFVCDRNLLDICKDKEMQDWEEGKDILLISKGNKIHECLK